MPLRTFAAYSLTLMPHTCMKTLKLVILIMLSVVADFGAVARARDLADALDSLDLALSRSPAVTRARFRHVDSLKHERGRHRRHRRLDRDIARSYAGLNIDSSLAYFRYVIDVAPAQEDSISEALTLMEYARQLGKQNYFSKAVSILDTLRPGQMPPLEKMTFYDVRTRLYLDEMAANPMGERRRQFRDQARSDLDSLRRLVSPYPGGAQLVGSMIMALEGDTAIAVGELLEVIDSLDASSSSYAIANGMMAALCRTNPSKRKEYLYYLAVAAEADARAGNCEAISLAILGSELLKDGDTDRALYYISTAARTLHNAGVFRTFPQYGYPFIDFVDSLRTREQSGRVAFFISVCLLVLVVVVSVLGFMYYDRRLRRSNKSLADARRTADAKDRYIGQLLDLCSSYIDNMEEFNRLVSRKIKANQTKDLYETVESGKILKQQTERFYTDFDHAVFQIFPDFDKSVNALFAQDKRIEVPEAGRLTPELRIAAFMRLGVTDSMQIAKFLGLSLNTVYTYRNRMRSRALDRDNFESELLEI